MEFIIMIPFYFVKTEISEKPFNVVAKVIKMKREIEISDRKFVVMHLGIKLGLSQK